MCVFVYVCVWCVCVCTREYPSLTNRHWVKEHAMACVDTRGCIMVHSGGTLYSGEDWYDRRLELMVVECVFFGGGGRNSECVR